MTSSLRWLILTLPFLSELALLAVLAIVGVNAGLGTAANVALAVLAPVAVGDHLGSRTGASRAAPAASSHGGSAPRSCSSSRCRGLAAVGALAWAIVFAAAAIGVAVVARVAVPDG